jgi:regulator of protease activity HflC (stomatin/prohibitin superfamily)
MITTLILISFIIIGAAVAILTRSNMYIITNNEYEYKEFNIKWLIKPISIIVIGLLIGLIQPFSLERVDAGHIGIKVNLTGNERGVSDYTYKTGWVVFNNWTENLYEFPTYQQHIEYDSVNVITKGGFSATIKPSFNYNLIPTSVGDMFTNLRVSIKDVEQGWLKTAIIGSVNDVANRWPVDSIFNNREQFETAIITECNKRVSKWFSVSQLRTNIIPPPALQASIIAKTQAIQNAQAKIQEALVAEANAQKLIATARGDSAQAVITASGEARAAIIAAEGEAEAMKLRQKELTPLYVDFIRASNWDGVLPTTMLGNSSNTLFNLK